MTSALVFLAGIALSSCLLGPFLVGVIRERRASDRRAETLQRALDTVYRELARMHAFYRNPHPLKSAVRWMSSGEIAALTQAAGKR